MKNSESKNLDKKPLCGIIMPISACENLSASHWSEIFGIIKIVCEESGFDCQLVSDAREVSVIQSRIVGNLYNCEMVICDVSTKNPNVMFELGMRLTFDKPVIIIKDNLTDYSFDTAPIEHLPYPRDLRYNDILNFKKALGEKLIATYEKSKDSNYSTFLKHFSINNISKIEEKEITSTEFILQSLKTIESQIKSISYQSRNDFDLTPNLNWLDSNVTIANANRLINYTVKEFMFQNAGRFPTFKEFEEQCRAEKSILLPYLKSSRDRQAIHELFMQYIAVSSLEDPFKKKPD